MSFHRAADHISRVSRAIRSYHMTVFRGAGLFAPRISRDPVTRRAAVFAFLYPSRGEFRMRMSTESVEFSGIDHFIDTARLAAD